MERPIGAELLDEFIDRSREVQELKAEIDRHHRDFERVRGVLTQAENDVNRGYIALADERAVWRRAAIQIRNIVG